MYNLWESLSDDYSIGISCWLLIVFDILLQVLPYDQLMLELDVTNVRELEDFLINECMYAVGSLRVWFSLFLLNPRFTLSAACFSYWNSLERL